MGGNHGHQLRPIEGPPDRTVPHSACSGWTTVANLSDERRSSDNVCVVWRQMWMASIVLLLLVLFLLLLLVMAVGRTRQDKPVRGSICPVGTTAWTAALVPLVPARRASWTASGTNPTTSEAA